MVKLVRSEDVVDVLGECLKFGFQISGNRGHQFVEPPSPIGLVKLIDLSPQCMLYFIDLDDNVFGYRNAIALQGVF